ncbi:hypothetical protein [Acinetobacter baumannii]|uniref:hypothetical protein n=1 Tax=Acinetobacter baumannii TaxID=470 RepID=UPI000F740074|nr:hypothetical protein [Acinetobacter baumannii]HCA4899791.1 hypothetical protein [Acinetobacter baumannii]
MFIVIMCKSKRKESPLAWLSKFLFQRGLPYLFIALALCNGIYFAYALLTGHFVDQFQVLDQ